MERNKCDLRCENKGDAYHTLSPDEVEILKVRVDFPVKVLCPDHYRQQFSMYSVGQKKCSDPCLRHSKPAKWRLSDISLDLANKVRNLTEHRVIPGQKLCSPCIAHLNELLQTSEIVVEAETEVNPPGEMNDDDDAGTEVDSQQFDSPM